MKMQVRPTRSRFLLLVFFPVSFLHAQSTPALSEIHQRLQDWRFMARQHAFVLVGEISRMKSIRQSRCRAGVEQKLEYTVSEVLWNEPDSPIGKGYKVSKGFIDCTQQPLHPPFRLGSKVIVLCGVSRGRGYVCLSPVQLTSDSLNKIEGWIDELRHAEGDPALLQIHERLVEDADLVSKSKLQVPKGAFMLNGEVMQPIAFLGEITWVEPMPRAWTVFPRREMHISAGRLLLGSYREPQITSWCNSIHCGGATAGTAVIAYCRVREHSPAECLISMTLPEQNVEKMEKWIREAFFPTRTTTSLINQSRNVLAAALSPCPSALGSRGEADLPRSAAGLAERSGVQCNERM
jgi:hypothetical protein